MSQLRLGSIQKILNMFRWFITLINNIWSRFAFNFGLLCLCMCFIFHYLYFVDWFDWLDWFDWFGPQVYFCGFCLYVLCKFPVCWIFCHIGCIEFVFVVLCFLCVWIYFCIDHCFVCVLICDVVSCLPQMCTQSHSFHICIFFVYVMILSLAHVFTIKWG